MAQRLDLVYAATETWKLALQRDKKLPTAATDPRVVKDPKGLKVTHAFWMLGQLRAERKKGEKGNRWLGYAQAILVSHDLATLEELMAISRRALFDQDPRCPICGHVESKHSLSQPHAITKLRVPVCPAPPLKKDDDS